MLERSDGRGDAAATGRDGRGRRPMSTSDAESQTFVFVL